MSNNGIINKSIFGSFVIYWFIITRCLYETVVKAHKNYSNVIEFLSLYGELSRFTRLL